MLAHSSSAGFWSKIFLAKLRCFRAAALGRSSVPGVVGTMVARSSPTREYFEVLGVIAGTTVVGWFLPLSYHALGHIYLLAVILLCLRVGRGPVLFAAVVSAVVWSGVFMPPRMSFSRMDFDDGMLLGIYFVVAIIAGQFTARSRADDRQERLREQRSTALFHLTRALAGANSLDEAAGAALRQADLLFGAQTALLLPVANGPWHLHPASSFQPERSELAVAEWAGKNGETAGRFTAIRPTAKGLHLPLLRAERVLGIFVVQWPEGTEEPAPVHRDLAGAFAAQIALLLEREEFRVAGEREKFFAESDRLHRTLLDCVSHELKTPLSVLRLAGEKMDTEDLTKRVRLVAEIRAATSRLEHLVANLLNQTRLASGGLAPRLDWCDARDLINAARRVVGDALAGRVVRAEIPTDLPLFRADAALMEQVVANLLLNAALHTPAGRPVRVTAAIENGGKRMLIRVADEGHGIPVELRKTLFQKFQRGAEARAGGLGLGLSIVRGFMLAQGGEVSAENAVEGGACFTLYLPHVSHGDVPNDER